jgi:hypothetical protein
MRELKEVREVKEVKEVDARISAIRYQRSGGKRRRLKS